MCLPISSAWWSCCAADALVGQDPFPARLGCVPCSVPVIHPNTYVALAEICAEHLDTWPYFWDSSNVICCKNLWWSMSQRCLEISPALGLIGSPLEPLRSVSKAPMGDSLPHEIVLNLLMDEE